MGSTHTNWGGDHSHGWSSSASLRQRRRNTSGSSLARSSSTRMSSQPAPSHRDHHTSAGTAPLRAPARTLRDELLRNRCKLLVLVKLHQLPHVVARFGADEANGKLARGVQRSAVKGEHLRGRGPHQSGFAQVASARECVGGARGGAGGRDLALVFSPRGHGHRGSPQVCTWQIPSLGFPPPPRAPRAHPPPSSHSCVSRAVA